MARFRLTPQKREFFVLYSRASRNAVDVAEMLVELLDKYPTDGEALISRIKERENIGDTLRHELVDLINRTFVTPFDRDDMYRLSSVLDDIVDHIDEVADDLGLYAVEQVPDKARAQADVVLRAVRELDEAIGLLEGFKDSSAQLIALRALEDEGDRLVRESVAELFRSESDPISVIRWKDIHEQLEEAVDACESAADVLEAILVQNR